jgi:hypothetical protein
MKNSGKGKCTDQHEIRIIQKVEVKKNKDVDSKTMEYE